MMDVVALAASFLGEGGQRFWNYCGNKGEAWCAAFVTTVLGMAGELGVISGNKFVAASEWRGGANSYEGYFKQNGQFHTANSGYIPQPGDIICWGKDGSATSNMGSHVGIVESVDPDGTVHTIEGNRGGKGAAGNSVGRYTYTPGTDAWANISGFGVPEYTNPPAGGGNYTGNTGIGGSGNGYYPDASAGNTIDYGLFDYKDHVAADGETLQDIADKYGIPLSLLLWYNELNEWDKLEPGQEIKVPIPQNQLDRPWEAGNENIERAHTMSVKVYHPVIKAEFYAEGEALAATAETMDNRVYGDKDMDFDIISCSTQRSMAADCPSMSITLTNRQDWYNILSPNDLVIVKMQRPEFGEDAAELHEELQEVFIGVIDDIRKSLDFSSGQPKRAIQVTARGMGKAFVNFNVGLVRNLTIDTSLGFMGDPVMGLLDLNSAEAIEKVWGMYVGNCIRYEFYNGMTLEDYISYQSVPNEIERLSDYESLTQYTGSLWNLFKELGNAPFNETFWEIRNGKAVCMHRHCPFNPDEWTGLPKRTIRDDDIVTDATGRSDLETYTVYITNLRMFNEDLKTFYNPIWYPPYYDKYGLSILEVTSKYESFGYGDEDMKEAVRKYETELFNWNIKNNQFANGQIVVKGRASYKVGEVVLLEYNGLEFYVEGVAHNFTVYGGWTTTLSVTRGILPEERFAPPWGSGQELTEWAMDKLTKMTGGTDIDWSQDSIAPPTFVSGGGWGGGSYPGGGVFNPGSGSFQPSGTGSNIAVPGNFAQSGCIPDDITRYERNWSSGTRQKQVYDLWKQNGSQNIGGIAAIGDRILVAMADGVIGTAGDLVDIHLGNGKVIKAVLADEKGTDRQHQYGHWQVYNGPGGVHSEGVSLIEWEIVGSTSQLLQTLKDQGWYMQPVTGVVNYGSGLNG